MSPDLQTDADIIEDDIFRCGARLLPLLLLDHATGENIIWATEDYAALGEAYEPGAPIEAALITGAHARTIQPRIVKSHADQVARTKDKAEVFTPSWLCNIQNNLLDESWLADGSVFNAPNSDGWQTSSRPIRFRKETTTSTRTAWQRYVSAPRLEAACGEAPYLASRYDTTTGDVIPVQDRIGLFDRKLRVVSEHTTTEARWHLFARRACKSIYGYEYQGDNLLLARENLLWTYLEHFAAKFDHAPGEAQLEEIADVIAWNLWQMDALTQRVPYHITQRTWTETNLLGETIRHVEADTSMQRPCVLRDWRTGAVIEYRSLLQKHAPHGGESS
ncbi:restriction endonuclease subunit M [Selenomonas sp.]|uniref:restriction endonuclease subunit M n=1 Tax=Selenomonas sp. TaxID=2053611 RepID=UPI0025DDA73B|nr:restriction endonuclease subunit M [Selenomonas sp.]MCI6282984.1 restriction endonuclease subunit M [Selenomonas sp.]